MIFSTFFMDIYLVYWTLSICIGGTWKTVIFSLLASGVPFFEVGGGWVGVVYDETELPLESSMVGSNIFVVQDQLNLNVLIDKKVALQNDWWSFG